MIRSIKEFIELRTQDDSRATYDNASESLWLEIVKEHPEYKEWVVRNKTIPSSILRILAFDSDWRVRFAVASKRKCEADLLEKLARDDVDAVRARVVWNKNTPAHVLEILRSDPSQTVGEALRSREGSHKQEQPEVIFEKQPDVDELSSFLRNDADSRATELASSAQIALEEGDILTAQRLFGRAGELLYQQVMNLTQRSAREVCRFLSATQYYRGGLYQEAKRICAQVKPKKLPKHLQQPYSQFTHDVNQRSDSHYKHAREKELRQTYRLVMLHNNKGAAWKFLELVRREPYLLRADQLAFLRGRCWSVLGNQRATSSFFGRAYRFDPTNKNYRFLFHDSLSKEGRFREVEESIAAEKVKGNEWQLNLELMMLYGAEALSIVRDQKREPKYTELRRREVESFDLAWKLYRCDAHTTQVESQTKMNYAFTLAWIAYEELGDSEGVLAHLTRWVNFQPSSPDPHILRGMHTYPAASALADFQYALQRETPIAWPDFFLAHNAFMGQNFKECIAFVDQGLRKNPHPELLSLLLKLKAACLDRGGMGNETQRDQLLQTAFEAERDSDMAGIVSMVEFPGSGFDTTAEFGVFVDMDALKAQTRARSQPYRNRLTEYFRAESEMVCVHDVI